MFILDPYFYSTLKSWEYLWPKLFRHYYKVTLINLTSKRHFYPHLFCFMLQTVIIFLLFHILNYFFPELKLFRSLGQTINMLNAHRLELESLFVKATYAEIYAIYFSLVCFIFIGANRHRMLLSDKIVLQTFLCSLLCSQ